MTKSDLRYFEKAKENAMESDFEKTHVGCIAVYKGQIISVGYNTNKTHPLQYKYNKFRTPNNQLKETFIPKMHAEISCLANIKNKDIQFNKVKLYVYRTRKDIPYGISRPCPSCMAMIKKLGIKNIYYTTDYGYAHETIEEELV